MKLPTGLDGALLAVAFVLLIVLLFYASATTVACWLETVDVVRMRLRHERKKAQYERRAQGKQ